MYKQPRPERDDTQFGALNKDMKSQKKQVNNSNPGVKENLLRLKMRKTVNQKVTRKFTVLGISFFFFRMNIVVHLEYFFFNSYSSIPILQNTFRVEEVFN